MTQLPLVSILLPTYKDAPALSKAIESVTAQQYDSWELVVIDDGLSDSARAIVFEYVKKDQRIRLLPYDGNHGIQKSLNKGLQAARGEYIARLDDDDRWTDAEKLLKQISYLEANSGCVLVGTSAAIANEDGNVIATYAILENDQEIRSRMLFKNCFLHPTIMARKSAIDQAGGYDESQQVLHVEDYDLWLRLGAKGSLHNISDVTTVLTIHSNSLTFKNRIVQAKKVRRLIRLYRDKYPYFYSASIILTVRIIGFTIIQYIPIPQRILYGIQKIYKKL
jgi:glycosyltransferase EpsE